MSLFSPLTRGIFVSVIGVIGVIEDARMMGPATVIFFVLPPFLRHDFPCEDLLCYEESEEEKKNHEQSIKNWIFFHCSSFRSWNHFHSRQVKRCHFAVRSWLCHGFIPTDLRCDRDRSDKDSSCNFSDNFSPQNIGGGGGGREETFEIGKKKVGVTEFTANLKESWTSWVESSAEFVGCTLSQ